MNELSITRTPEIIGAEIRSLTSQARVMVLHYGIEIGRRLVEAKELVKHGEWMTFLKEQTEFSTSSASRFMQLYEAYGADQSSLFGAESNFPTLGNLSISNALRLLALPEEERESFALENDVEHKSAREVEKLITERNELIMEKAQLSTALAEREAEMNDKDEAAAAAIERLEKKLEAAQEELSRAEKKARELSEQPVEVRVERDEAAIQAAADKAAAEARAKADKELDKAQKTHAKELRQRSDELKKVQDELAALKAEARSGEESAARVKELEARLAMAAPEVAVFKAAFERVQTEFNNMLSVLPTVSDEVTTAKLRAAVIAVLEQFERRMSNET